MNLQVFFTTLIVGILYLVINSFLIGIFISRKIGLPINNVAEYIIIGAMFLFHYVIIFYIANYYFIRLYGNMLSIVALLIPLLISFYSVIRYHGIIYNLSSILRETKRVLRKIFGNPYYLYTLIAASMISFFVVFNYYANCYDYYDYYHYIAGNYHIANGLLHKEAILFNTIIVMFNGIYYEIINPRAFGVFLFILFMVLLYSISKTYLRGKEIFLVLIYILLPSIMALYMYEFLYLEAVFITVLLVVLWSIVKEDLRLILLSSPLLLFTKGYGFLIFGSIAVCFLYMRRVGRIDRKLLILSSSIPVLAFILAISFSGNVSFFTTSLLKFVIITSFLAIAAWFLNPNLKAINEPIKTVFSNISTVLYVLPLILYTIYFVSNIVFYDAVNFEVNPGLLKIIISLNLTRIAVGSLGKTPVTAVLVNAVLGVFNNMTLPYVITLSLIFSIIILLIRGKTSMTPSVDLLCFFVFVFLFNYVYVFIIKFDGLYYSFNYRYLIPISVLLVFLSLTYINRIESKIISILTLSLLAASSISIFYLSMHGLIFDKRSFVLFFQKNPIFPVISILLFVILAFYYLSRGSGIDRFENKIVYAMVLILIISMVIMGSVVYKGLYKDTTPDDPEFSQYIYSNTTIRQYYTMYIDYKKIIDYIDKIYLRDSAGIVLTINIPLVEIDPSRYLKTAGNIYISVLKSNPENITCILMPKNTCPEPMYLMKRDLLANNTIIGEINVDGKTVVESEYFYLKCIRLNSST